MTRRKRHPSPPPKTAWHPMFIVAVEETLEPRFWQVLGEFLLNKEPGRADMVIIRRAGKGEPPLPPRMRTVLAELRDHNLVHLKGSTDELERVDATQLHHYALGYLLATKLDDPSLLALRVVAPALTPRFAEQVRRLHGELAPTARPGVHEGHLGPFDLRLIETSVACDVPHEELLCVFSPRFLHERHLPPPVDETERHLYNRMYRCIEQLARSPEAAMTKDVELVHKRWTEDVAEFLPTMDLKIALRNLAPEQRLAGLSPEQRFAGLSEAEHVLALPDPLLRALSADYLATLPGDVQVKVRARLQR